MIITRTPFRISFVGGGSDMEDFYKIHPGAVLSTTINKYIYVSTHRYFEPGKFHIRYSRVETVDSVSAVEHPIVRRVLEKFAIKGGLEITSTGDIPSGTGLGSSSSFTTGLIHNLYTLNHEYATKEQLSRDACEIEIKQLGEPIGKQDQYAAAYGGLNKLEFFSSGEVRVTPIHLTDDVSQTLQNNLLMFYLGNQRKSSVILAEQKINLRSKDGINILLEMTQLAGELENNLYHEDLRGFGQILHKNWLLKKRLASKISNGEIDALYETALCNGAIGGKILGAGGGGCFLVYCEEHNQEKLRRAMKPLREIPFRFENEGSKVVYISGDQ